MNLIGNITLWSLRLGMVLFLALGASCEATDDAARDDGETDTRSSDDRTRDASGSLTIHVVDASNVPDAQQPGSCLWRWSTFQCGP